MFSSFPFVAYLLQKNSKDNHILFTSFLLLIDKNKSCKVIHLKSTTTSNYYVGRTNTKGGGNINKNTYKLLKKMDKLCFLTIEPFSRTTGLRSIFAHECFKDSVLLKLSYHSQSSSIINIMRKKYSFLSMTKR
jgi:hypothetical protein